jgi:oxaloacetate decarboxylase alpha subunit
MSRMRIVDTTLRDGHQCLWATRMSTPMMLPVLDRMDRVGFDVIELMGAVHFDTCVRFLGENPWDRLKLFRDRFQRTTRQAIIRSKCALRFDLEPDDINRLWYERLFLNGIENLVAFDGLHDLDNLEDGLKYAKSLGARTQGWLIFSESPVHTDALYVTKAREFLDRCDVDSLMIEDTSGILTPERLRSLVPAIQAEIGDEVPLGLHTHNLAGLGQSLYIEAAKLGIDNIYTCIAPIADGNAPPSIQTTLRNLRHYGNEFEIDDALLGEISQHFEDVAIRSGHPLGRPQDFDAASFDHQIPGGVMSNLVGQLDAAGLSDKLPAVLEECGRIRAETGWPIMVTPFSQFVGVQATLNVLTGERYGQVTDEMKKYALGYYGKLLSPVAPNVLDRIVESGSKSIALTPPKPEPALPALRKRYPDADDEELLLWHSFPEEVVRNMYAAKLDTTDYASGALVHLVEEIAKRPKLSRVFISKGSMTVDIRGT